MADLHGNEPVEFDNGTADALKSALTGAADAIEGQVGSRQSYVSTALQDFRGHFSDLFRTNGSTAASDAARIVSSLRDVAGWVQTMKESAARENARRKTARDWYEEHEDRNLLEKGIDWLTGDDQPPQVEHEDPPTFPSSSPSTAPRQTPTPGNGGGGGGGTSSARPEDLRSFATGSSGLNGNLQGKPSALSGKLADFHADCHWGTIDASGLVSAFSRWLTANDQDVTWANTVADAFAAAGGEGNVSTVSDAALGAALAAAGVSASRSDLTIDPPTAYGAQPTTGFSMDPVNTTTGNFIEPEIDLAFAGASATLRCTRMYNSLDEHVGVFGPGWSSLLEIRLLLDDDGATYVGADGRQIRFPRLGDGWERGVGENRWLHADGDLLVVTDNEGGRSAFTRSGLWTGSSTGPGTAVRVERDASDAVVRLVHERGRSIDIEHVGGRVAALRGSDGRRVEYGYDDHGRLVTVTDAVGTRRYGWDDDGLVTTVTSAAGVVEVANTYDDQRRVVEQRTPHGRTVRFAYLPGRVTVVSDQDGTRSNSYIADAKGRLVGVLDADDQRQSMAYDAHGNLVSATERDGAVTVHAYDERGRKVRTVTPAGGDITYGYDDQDRVTTVVTESGSVVTYEYVGADRDPSVVTDPVGGRSEMLWTDGLLQRVTDPTGVTVVLDHDASGDLVATSNAVGDVARIERDAAGRPVAAVSPSGARTEYTYDGAGLLVQRVDADGAVWRFEHTSGGRIAAVVDPLGGRTAYTYGADGELATETDPLGRVTTRTSDDQGDLGSVTLPDGGTWSSERDALSRLRAVTDPTGAVWRREYDVTGRLVATIDPTGVRVESASDPATGVATLRDAFSATTIRSDEYGRPVEVAAADAGSELVTYDAAGRPVELVDGDGGLTRLERDLAGRVVALVTPSGSRLTYEYDACGRPAASVDAIGARTVLGYDADSRVVTRTLPSGDVETTAYDQVGRVVARSTPGAGTTRTGWDAAGRLVSLSDAGSGVRRFRYDSAGQLVEAVDGNGGVTRFTHDAAGRVLTTTDPLGGVTERSYDAAGRVVAVTDPLGRTTTAAYDAAGRQVRQTDPDGHVTEWTYDAAGRQHQVLVDGTVRSELARDLVERTLVVTDTTGGVGHDVDHVLQSDRRGLLVGRSRGARGIAWEYDADGNRIARTGPDGVRTVYRRDAAGRVVAVEQGDVVGTFTYDADGRVVRSATGDLVQSWSYERGALVAHTTTTSDATETTRIERDADARITAVSRPDGRVAYTYDGAGQLLSARDDAGRARTWEYDAAGRLVRETVDGVVTAHEYDAAGQRTATVTDGARTEYVHDGLGRRIRRTDADGSTTEFAWTDLGYLSSIVERSADYTETGRTELWVDVLGELAAVGGAETWWDTAAAVPSLVTIAGTAVLEAPGGVTAIGGSATSAGWRSARATDVEDPWAVLGAVTGLQAGLALPAGVTLTANGGVSVAGLEWLGARAYDPVARGFLSVDPLAPVLGTGWSGNPYAYAGNDPLHAVDPLGLRPATDADLQAYRDAHQGAIAAVKDWADDHAYLIAGVAIVAGVALMCTGVGGPAGIALMAASGALLSGGISVASQKAQTGTVDWGKAGVDTLVGGVLGAAGGGAAMFGKAAMASAPAGQMARAVAVNAGVNGGVGAVGGAGTYLVEHGGRIDNGWEFAGQIVGGGVGGAAGGLAGPAGGSIAQHFGQSSTGIFAKGSSVALTGLSSAAGETTNEIVSGGDLDGGKIALAGATGSGLAATQTYVGPKVHLPEMRNVDVMAQVPHFHPRTLSSTFDMTKVNTRGLWASSVAGTLAGSGFDILTH